MKRTIAHVRLMILLSVLFAPHALAAQVSPDSLGDAVAWQIQRGGNAHAVSGIVFSSSGEALSGAQVVFPKTGVGALTDDNGRFRLEAPGTGAWTLQIQQIGYRAAETKVHIPVNAGIFVTAVLAELQTRPCGLNVCSGGSGCKDLSVVVLDSVTMASPNALVTLRVERGDSSWVREAQMDSTTRSTGIGLGFPIATPGHYDIEVRAAGYHPWRREKVALSLTEECHPVLRNRDHVARLVPHGSGSDGIQVRTTDRSTTTTDTATVMRFRVVDHVGEPAAARIRLERADSPADAIVSYANEDGRLDLHDIPAGDYTLSVSWIGARTLVDTVSVAAGMEVDVHAALSYEVVALSCTMRIGIPP